MHGVSYGTITAVAAYLMAFLGSALGLRCVVRSVHYPSGWKPGWLFLGAAAMGCGIWMMHFIAMLDFSAPGATVTFDVGRTVASLVVAVLVVGIGMLIVGHWGARPVVLGVSGAATGLGVAAMHYLGMSAMHINATVHYRTPMVVVSLVIAVGAATAALWSAVSIRGFFSSLVASLIMAVAISGMHYTAMAAISLHVYPTASVPPGKSAVALLPLLIGPGFYLLLATAIVLFDPLVLAGESDLDFEPYAPAPSLPENHISDVYRTYPPVRR
ncbi:MHYT domain-containing protein [Streptomyces sp. NPDC001288]|uniref:MHYT domain-containing protein n=1 Tax=unclassified Streptomyces TaxID=2593676 RepID=UPI003329FA73